MSNNIPEFYGNDQLNKTDQNLEHILLFLQKHTQEKALNKLLNRNNKRMHFVAWQRSADITDTNSKQIKAGKGMEKDINRNC